MISLLKLIACCCVLFIQCVSGGLLGFGTEPKPRPINRRVGPFASRPAPQQPLQAAPGRLLHHPYMQQPSQSWGQSSHEFQERFDQYSEVSVPETPEPYRVPFSETRQAPVVETPAPKKVLMPIISSGYASTNFQGGRYGVSDPPKKDKKKEKEEKKVFTNDLAVKTSKTDTEVPIVEEIVTDETIITTTTAVSTTTTTTTPTPTSTPQPQQLLIEEKIVSGPIDPIGQTGNEDLIIGSHPPSQQPQESSPYFPDIPDFVADSATEDVSQKYETELHSGPTAEAVDIAPSDRDPFIIPEADVAAANVQRPQSGQEIRGSVESVSLFDETQPSADTEDDGLIIQPGEDVPIDVESGQFVRFVAQPPKQINIVVPNANANPLPSKPAPINVDEEGYFKPPKVEPSDTYQAGYQQIDFPHSTGGGQFPASVNPDIIDPNDYHEDRPSFSSGTNKQAPQEFYPLGKPPPNVPLTDEISPNVVTPKPAEVKETPKPATSFLDFLIPSFIRGSSKTDPEGPPKQPPPPPANVNPRQRVAPPPPKASLSRPLNTFPHPLELGGKNNPIRVPIGPDGIPQLPTPPGWNRPPHDVLSKRKMYRIEQDPVNSMEETTDSVTVREEELMSEIPTLEIQMPKLKLPVPPPRLPPNFNRPRPEVAPMPATTAPFISLPRLTLERRPAPSVASSSEEFQLSEGSPKRRQLPESGLIPNTPEFSANPDELLQITEDYKSKLSDPDFIENITKAHVFHATNLNDENYLRLDDPTVNAAPIQYSPHVFHIQDSNPFGEKPDSIRSDIHEPAYNPLPYNPYPSQPEPVLPEQPSLADIAPAAKLVHTSKENHFDRPEVVYEPIDHYSKRVESRKVDQFHPLNALYDSQVQAEEDFTVPTEPPALEELTEETEGTTESSTFAEPETTTQYIDPIAEHVNKLLRHYLTTQEPLRGVPSLLFDDETGSVILEYLSPDGQQGQVEEVTQDIQNTEVATLQTFQAIPEDHERSDNHQMPDESQLYHPEDAEQYMLQAADGQPSLVQFEKVFVPSSEVKNADWFIMDSEGKKRIMNQGQEVVNVGQQVESAESLTEVPTTEETIGSTDLFEGQTEATNAALERQTEGGFHPVLNPVTIPDEFIGE